MIMSNLICLPPTGISSNLSPWLLWGIWTNRNALLFDNRAVSAKSTMEKSVSSVREWIAAQATAPRPTKSPAQHRPQAPVRTDIVRCNTDAAWSGTTLRAGIGWHFDDPVSGSHTEGARSLELISSPLMAEALAMREAIREAKHASVTDVWFRTDSQELARAVNSKSYPVELFGVLMDIESLSYCFDFFFVSFVGRENNVVADSLAKAALSSFPSTLY